MKKGAVEEYVGEAKAHLLAAQLQMERAKKAYEDAIICCGLTAAELELAEETTLEQLAGYLKIAKEASDKAEQAWKEAKAELASAQEEKSALDDAYLDVKALAQKAEDAMKVA
jgi:cobalamin biosynthesis protein CbiD